MSRKIFIALILLPSYLQAVEFINFQPKKEWQVKEFVKTPDRQLNIWRIDKNSTVVFIQVAANMTHNTRTTSSQPKAFKMKKTRFGNCKYSTGQNQKSGNKTYFSQWHCTTKNGVLWISAYSDNIKKTAHHQFKNIFNYYLK